MPMPSPIHHLAFVPWSFWPSTRQSEIQYVRYTCVLNYARITYVFSILILGIKCFNHGIDLPSKSVDQLWPTGV